MRKSIVFLFAFSVFASVDAIAQSVGISDGEITPDKSAALEIRTNSKGLLIPRLTQAERDAISDPAIGLLVFQTNADPGFYYYNGTSWKSVGSSSSDSDSDPYNEIQILSLSNDTLYLSDGGFVKLPSITDNMGNHSASQNIHLNEYYLSSDGDNEGLLINTNGDAVLSNKLEVSGETTLNSLTVNGTTNLAANSVQTVELDNDAVNNEKIADNAITTAKIQDAQITSAKLHPMGASTDQFLSYNGTSWVPKSISGGLTYMGTWNASTNTPTLNDKSGQNSEYYIVNTAGTQNLGSGSITFNTGDWLIHNGTSWQKMNNSNDVNSVFGRKGAVTAQIGDYTWNQINKTTSSIDDIANVEAPTATAGTLLVGNGTVWNGTAISGDVTLDATGNMQIKSHAILYADIQNATGPSNTILRWNGTQWEETLLSSIEGDASPTNEIQNLTLADNILSLSGDATPVSLTSYLDNTDSQSLSLASNTLSLTNGGSVSLAPYIQTLTFSSPTLTLSSGNSVNLSSLTGTDEQQLTLSGNTLSIESGNSIDLTPFKDNTDAQTLTFSSPTLTISNGNSIDLSEFKDNTDNQSLSLASNTLSLTNGGSVSLAPYSQTLTFSSPTLTITNGNSVDLSTLAGTDDQELTLSGNTLSIENGNSVDLSKYIDNTDGQDLTLSSNTLGITGSSSTVNLGNYLNEQDLSFTGTNLSITGGSSINLSSLKDNLGNHTATQNISTNGFWLSNNGADQGIFINSVGQVGVGLNNPSVALHVESNDVTQIMVESNSSSMNGMLYLKCNNISTPSNSDNYILFVNSEGTPLARVGGDGAGVNFFSLSDKRLKQNIAPTKYGLNDLMKIKVCDYTILNNPKLETGFIAQDLYEIYPLAVSKGGNNPKTQPWGVDYSRLSPLITVAVQELNTKVEELRTEVQTLKTENEQLKARLSNMDNNEQRLAELETQVKALLKTTGQVSMK